MFNMNEDFMKKMESILSVAEKSKGELKKIQCEGNAGGGLIKVVCDGTMEILSIAIDPVAVDPRDVKMLEELIVAAVNDAGRKVREELQMKLPQMAGESFFQGKPD